MQKLLTIIVPMYNVERYIKKCLDSCILFTDNRVVDTMKMSRLEVIIINDGTTDSSAEISREYTLRYPETFRQIDKDNGGHGSAWNIGIREARGKYLRFLDADDWLTNLDRLICDLTVYDADIVFSHLSRYSAAKQSAISYRIYDEYGVINHISHFNFSKNKYIDVLNFVYATYKTSLLRFDFDIFLEQCKYDDTLLFLAPSIRARNYVCLNYVVYNYYIGRPGQSLSLEKTQSGIIQRYQNLEYSIDFFETHRRNGMDEHLLCGVRDIYARLSMVILRGLTVLPYRECKWYSRKIFVFFKSAEGFSCQRLRKYGKYPFLLYYLLIRIRMFLREYEKRTCHSAV